MKGIETFLRAAALVCASVTGAQAADDVMVIFDGSNSMWGQIDGTAKIDIARGVMGDLIGNWDESSNVGLMAYGHRRAADCKDIEVLIPPGPLDRAGLIARIDAITPRGRTPLTDAVEQAAEILFYRENPATVILISDGIESCQRDPCALAEALEGDGIDFTAHVVGFGLGAEEDQESLACIAENTGGRFLAAKNADELEAAFSEVGQTVSQEVPAAQDEASAQDTAETGSGWMLEFDGSTHAGNLAYVDPETPELRLVNDAAVNLVLTLPALDTGTYDVRAAYLAFGHEGICQYRPYDSAKRGKAFRVTIDESRATSLSGEFDGLLHCAASSEPKPVSGQFQLEGDIK